MTLTRSLVVAAGAGTFVGSAAGLRTAWGAGFGAGLVSPWPVRCVAGAASAGTVRPRDSVR